MIQGGDRRQNRVPPNLKLGGTHFWLRYSRIDFRHSASVRPWMVFDHQGHTPDTTSSARVTTARVVSAMSDARVSEIECLAGNILHVEPRVCFGGNSIQSVAQTHIFLSHTLQVRDQLFGVFWHYSPFCSSGAV